jgi:hypothetical protein
MNAKSEPKHMFLRGTIYEVGAKPHKKLIGDLMRVASELVSPHPEDWCLDPCPRKRTVVCHCPYVGGEEVNAPATFVAGQVIHGNAIVFDYEAMAEAGFLPPEGE